MPLLLGQIIYTSFTGIGFRLLASAQVPKEIQQAFIEGVASQHWDSYAPPKSGYRAVYLHQVTPESNLFGWLYNDGADDMDRTHVPYFICYYLAGPLHAVQLENIFTCLHKGPLALIDRHNIPATLDNIFVPNFWSYQPARPGVAIGLGVRKRSHIALKQGELLDLLVPIDEKQMVIELNGQAEEQLFVDLSIYTHYLVGDIAPGAAALNEDANAIETGGTQAYRGYKEELQRYEQALVSVIEREYPISDNTRDMLKHLQQDLQLTDEDTNLIEACLTLDENIKVIQAQITPQERLQRYEQALIEAIKREYPFSKNTRHMLKSLQQDLQLKDEDINLIEACLSLDENIELIQAPPAPLGNFVGVIKKLLGKKWAT